MRAICDPLRLTQNQSFQHHRFSRTLILLAALLSVSAVSVVAIQPSASQRGLNPTIPRAIRAKYRTIGDGKDWRNPKVTIRAEGVEVVSDVTGEPTIVSPSELHDLLI